MYPRSYDFICRVYSFKNLNKFNFLYLVCLIITSFLLFVSNGNSIIDLIDLIDLILRIMFF